MGKGSFRKCFRIGCAVNLWSSHAKASLQLEASLSSLKVVLLQRQLLLDTSDILQLSVGVGGVPWSIT